MTYRHTQRGALLIAAFAAAVAILAWVAAADGLTAGEAAMLGLVAAAGWLFSSLSVEVTPERMRIWFGPGWIRRTIRLRDVERARAVRVPWYVGWGMRWWGHWIYNVSGRQAVTLQLRDGGRFSVGTDEPEALLAALRQAGVTVETA